MRNYSHRLFDHSAACSVVIKPPDCLSQYCLYKPPIFRSFLWVPSSTTWPSERTIILSIFAKVDNRWAIANTVLFSITNSSAFCMELSTSLSKALVASSKTRIGESFKIDRARAILCLWPPESLTPCSPRCASSVSYTHLTLPTKRIV